MELVLLAQILNVIGNVLAELICNREDRKHISPKIIIPGWERWLRD